MRLPAKSSWLLQQTGPGASRGKMLLCTLHLVVECGSKKGAGTQPGCSLLVKLQPAAPLVI